jgi:hypothetical protein
VNASGTAADRQRVRNKCGTLCNAWLRHGDARINCGARVYWARIVLFAVTLSWDILPASIRPIDAKGRSAAFAAPSVRL